MDYMTEEQKEKVSIIEKRANATLGLKLKQNSIADFDDRSAEEIKQMSDDEFVMYLCRTNKLEYFTIESSLNCREKIGKVPYAYRDTFAAYFLRDLDNKDVVLGERNHKQENEFLNQLAKIGVYVTKIGDGIPFITDMKGFESAILNGKKAKDIEFCIGKKSDFVGNLSAYKQRKKFVNGIREKLNELVKEPNSSSLNRESAEELKSDMPEEEFLGSDEDLFAGLEIDDLEDSSLEIGNQPIQTPLKDSKSSNMQKNSNTPKNRYMQKTNSLKGENIDKDKEVIAQFLRANFKRYGKDATIKAFEQYHARQGNILKVRTEKEEHTFKGQDKALRVLNAKYIESILKNAKNVEQNFDMNPKARRLGEVVIAMYSKWKDKGEKEEEIFDKINDALTALVIEGKTEQFDLKTTDMNHNKIINFANQREMTSEELKYKENELAFISAQDAISIIVSTELDQILEQERENAKKEGHTPTFEKTDLDLGLEDFEKTKDAMQISIGHRKQSIPQDKKSTVMANVQAQKTQLLVRTFRKDKDGNTIPTKKPMWGQLKEADDEMKQKVNACHMLMKEIQELRKKITDAKISWDIKNSEEKKGLEKTIQEDEQKLLHMIRDYHEMMIKDGKNITEYISLEEMIQKMNHTKDVKSTKTRNQSSNEVSI